MIEGIFRTSVVDIKDGCSKSMRSGEMSANICVLKFWFMHLKTAAVLGHINPNLTFSRHFHPSNPQMRNITSNLSSESNKANSATRTSFRSKQSSSQDPDQYQTL